MALGVPFAFRLRNRFIKSVIIGLIIIALLWSASRTAMIGGGGGLLFGLLVHKIKLGRFTRSAIVCFLFMLSIVPPFLGLSDGYGTGRGAIWRSSLDMYGRDQPFFGFGSGVYGSDPVLMQEIGFVELGHSHNTFLTEMMRDGPIMAIAMMLVLCVCLVRAVRVDRYAPYIAAYAVVLAVRCAVEEVSPMRILPWEGGCFIPLIMLLDTAVELTPPRSRVC
ncbi:MAG: O-antigen ligase family protein [Propionibacteriaceae bacterium]|nr:O-antigen ligase family protein [Propionibacteriaceae bacterium]